MRGHDFRSTLRNLIGAVAILPMLAANSFALPESAGGSARADTPARKPAPLDLEKVLVLEKIRPKGQWYKATVPDTLDLADRARCSINALIGNTEPREYYGVYQVIYLDKTPPKKDALTWNITPKNSRTLPLMRTMSGSDERLEAETRNDARDDERSPRGRQHVLSIRRLRPAEGDLLSADECEPHAGDAELAGARRRSGVG